MSRRRKVYKKEEKVDSRYGSPAVARLISTVMKRGKKSLAERIVYAAIDKSREGSDSVDPLEVLNKALENVRPRLEVKSRRVGGATYQVPMEVTPAGKSRWRCAGSCNTPTVAAASVWPIRSLRKSKTPLKVRATRSRNARTLTRWRRRTERLRISAGNFMATATMEQKIRPPRIRTRRIASFRSSGRATSVSPRTLMPARPRSPSACCFTPA